MNSFSVIWINFGIDRSKAQATFRQPLIAEVRIQFQFGPCDICGGDSDIATLFFFFRNTAVLPRQLHPTIPPYSS